MSNLHRSELGHLMNMKDDNDQVTVFKKSAETLIREYGQVELNSEEFQRKLFRCELSCKGMCCYGGVSVDKDTATVLQKLADERKSDFEAMGLNLSAPVVAPAEWRGVVSYITALKPRQFRSQVSDYPAHFDETACVFLMEDARCGLQVLSEIDGKHPWYYKPFSCWLLPIKLWKGAIRLFDTASDPFTYSDFPGFISRTRCGRTDENGVVAAELLKPELEHLGRLLKRDLLGELVRSRNSNSTVKPISK